MPRVARAQAQGHPVSRNSRTPGSFGGLASCSSRLIQGSLTGGQWGAVAKVLSQWYHTCGVSVAMCTWRYPREGQ